MAESCPPEKRTSAPWEDGEPGVMERTIRLGVMRFARPVPYTIRTGPETSGLRAGGVTFPQSGKKSFPVRHKAKQAGNTRVKSGNLTAVT